VTTSLLAEQLDPAALAAAVAAPEAAVPSTRRKSVLTLSLCALAINGTAAFVTLPSDLQLPDVGSLAERLPRWKDSTPKPDPVIATLKDIQSAQQQHAASLQENNNSLRENNNSLQQQTALLQQDTMVLRQSITDERVDVKKISSQLSTLIAKVDALQNTMMTNITSSIPRGHARQRLLTRKWTARQSKPVGPVSVGGAPLTIPVAASAPGKPKS
jgi:hypothetical protein